MVEGWRGGFFNLKGRFVFKKQSGLKGKPHTQGNLCVETNRQYPFGQRAVAFSLLSVFLCNAESQYTRKLGL